LPASVCSILAARLAIAKVLDEWPQRGHDGEQLSLIALPTVFGMLIDGLCHLMVARGFNRTALLGVAGVFKDLCAPCEA